MEKRNTRRFEADSPIICSMFNSNRDFDAQLLNYSQGGICFKSVKNFKERCSVLLRSSGTIPLRSTGGTWDGVRNISLAEVKWSSEVSEGDEAYFIMGARYYFQE